MKRFGTVLPVLVWCIGICGAVHAQGYVATGPFKTFICTGLIHNDCREIRVDAVKYEGKMHILPEVWEEVDVFLNGNCYMTLDTESVNPMIDDDLEFFSYNESKELEEVDDIGKRIYFSCEEKKDE